MTEFDSEYHVRIQSTNFEEIMNNVYSLSRPQGLGILHFEEGNTMPKECMAYYKQQMEEKKSAHADYTKGRSMKFNLYQDDKGYFTENNLVDHSDEQLKALMEK